MSHTPQTVAFVPSKGLELSAWQYSIGNRPMMIGARQIDSNSLRPPNGWFDK
jgi:hypothetical protein